ncbi:MAG: ABC transporter permease, partial [Vicinamibacterales bacterium]
MRKAPTLTIATIATLALGIGLNAGVFTVVSGLLLRPRVTVDPATFIHVQPEYSGSRVPIHESPALSTADYVALRDRATTVRALAAWTVRGLRLGRNASTSELTLLVSCNFFDVYGLDGMERGRTFRGDECAERGPHVAIISDEIWQRRFDADPDILSKPLFLNGAPYTIVGVTPPKFAGQTRGEGVWIPYALEPAVTRGASALDNPDVAWLWVDGRLAPGATPSAVRSELNVLIKQQDALVPGRQSGIAITNGALIHDPAVRPVAMLLVPLVLGSVGLVLLIAAGNVTLLLLSRAVARQREIAVRLAIGCSRARLVRMLLTESVLLALVGMPISIWLAWQAPGVMRRMIPTMPFYPLEPDVAVFSYLAAASLTAGIAAGLAPAIESLRQRLAPMLAGHDALAHGRGRSRLRDVLIGAQVGMSLVLLAGTALFLRAERSIAVRSPSVDAAHVLTAPYNPPLHASSGRMAAFTSRLEQIPGVRSIAYAAGAGDSGSAEIPSLVVDGRTVETARDVPIDLVSASYFETLRLPLRQGRGFADADAAATVRPLVISDALAAVWWPRGGALGARVTAGDGRRFEVTGIVHPDVAFVGGTADTIQAFTLVPVDPPPGTFYLRFDGDAAALTTAVRGVLRDVNPDAPAMPITLAASDAAVASKFMPLVEMVGSLGVTAIVLALVGVYGVVSFAVGRRAREIGVRIALGATPADIVRLVLATGTPPIAAGVAGGLLLTIPGAIALTRLFRYTPVPLRVADPLPYAAVAIGLFAVSLATML